MIEDCKPLADYYEALVDRVSRFSLLLQRNGQLESSQEFQGVSSSKFVEKSGDLMREFMRRQREEQRVDLETEKWDTVIFPTVQMGVFNINQVRQRPEDQLTSSSCQDTEITSEILTAGADQSSYHFATGYFNLTDTFMKNILEKRSSRYSILMAPPEANGFLGAKFPAGGIPHAYTLIARRFWQSLEGRERTRVRMWEFRRPDWTFHGKGLWYSENLRPCLTMVGSPNFGYRSERRDLESQIVILTRSQDLQQRLGEEQEKLYSPAELVTTKTWAEEDRQVPTWVKLVVAFARKWF